MKHYQIRLRRKQKRPDGADPVRPIDNDLSLTILIHLFFYPRQNFSTLLISLRVKKLIKEAK